MAGNHKGARDLLRRNSAQKKTEGDNAGRGFGPVQGNPDERFCSVNRKKPF